MVRAVKSHRVGQALVDDGVVAPVYRAVVAFECGQCAGAIGPGEMFSRQARRAPVSAMVAPTTRGSTIIGPVSYAKLYIA